MKTPQNTWLFRPSHNPLRSDGYDAGWARLGTSRFCKARRREVVETRSNCAVLQSHRRTKFSSLALGKISQESYVSAK